MHLKIVDGIVEDAKFQTYGCVYSIACADATADLVHGATVANAKALTPEDVVRSLDRSS